MSPRILECLQNADIIAAEDTRNSIKLLNHFDIHTPMTSYHEFNKVEKAHTLIAQLREGKNVALITDAGTPAISDPGEVLVRMCIEAGITVTSLPGPCACITALTLSGLDTRRFVFEGFLPREKKERSAVLKSIENETRTMVFYEAPHHLRQTLADLASAFGGARKISLCRELTKLHEEIARMTLAEAVSHYAETEPRGEYVLIVAGAEERTETVSLEDGVARTRALMESGLRVKDAAKQAAEETGIPKNKLYAAVISEE